LYEANDVLKGDEAERNLTRGNPLVRGPLNRSSGAKRNNRPIVLALCTLAVVGAFLYVFAAGYLDAPPVYPIDWRAKIAIFDARISMNLTIPQGIGVGNPLWNNHTLDGFGPPGYAPLSTREVPAKDGTATIYIQSNTVRFYYIGDFFNIWGKPISRTCVTAANYCADATNPPPFITEGSKAFCLSPQIVFENYLTTGLEWEIFIGSPGVPGFQANQCR